jgi:hypothetical protein
LHSVHNFVEMLMQALDDAGAEAAGRDKLLNASLANADQGKLGSSEERVRRYQEKDQQHPEQHKGDHGCAILTFQRGWEGYRLD